MRARDRCETCYWYDGQFRCQHPDKSVRLFKACTLFKSLSEVFPVTAAIPCAACGNDPWGWSMGSGSEYDDRRTYYLGCRTCRRILSAKGYDTRFIGGKYETSRKEVVQEGLRLEWNKMQDEYIETVVVPRKDLEDLKRDKARLDWLDRQREQYIVERLGALRSDWRDDVDGSEHGEPLERLVRILRRIGSAPSIRSGIDREMAREEEP